MYPLSPIRALTVSPLSINTNLDSMIVACCSGVRSLMSTSGQAPEETRCSILCFIPFIAFFLSSPSVL